MAKPKVKPGTPHPTKRGMVMGTKGRYVAKSTYNKQVKASQPKPVKTNPIGAPRGAQGPAQPPQQGPSRRTPSTIGGDTGRRNVTNKYGTKGTPQSGPPGIGNRPRFRPNVRRPGPGGGTAAGMVGLEIASKMAQTIGKPGQSKMSGLGIDPSRLPKGEKKPGVQGRNTRGNQGGSRASVTRKPKQETKPKREVTSRNRRGRPTSYAKPVQPARRGMSNIPPKEGTGKGSPNDKKPPVTKNRQNVTPKPKVKVKPKTKPQTSGVGPVASGRAYSTKVTGKSVSRQRVDELRAMRERSKKRQAEMKKKKKK